LLDSQTKLQTLAAHALSLKDLYVHTVSLYVSTTSNQSVTYTAGPGRKVSAGSKLLTSFVYDTHHITLMLPSMVSCVLNIQKANITWRKITGAIRN
jgi:hypothetical protein